MHIFQKKKKLDDRDDKCVFLGVSETWCASICCKYEVAAVVRVPIPPVRYDVLTQVKDELSYLTVYNDCGDVFMLDM